MNKEVFPSPEWVASLCLALNSDSLYSRAAAKWVYGPVGVICEAAPDIGLAEDAGIWLDLHQGGCREARLMSGEEAAAAPFSVRGEYGKWRQVIEGELDPIRAILQGKLRFSGSLPRVIRFVRASQAMIKAAHAVPTRFLDD